MSASESRRPVNAALQRVSAWRPDIAVVLGSGVASLAEGLVVDGAVSYEELDWPRTMVSGHENRLLLARAKAAGGRELKLALACGRPHRYEGWKDEELERPVTSLAAAGVGRFLFTNTSGGLGGTSPGSLVVCDEVVDLQRPPRGREPERLRLFEQPHRTTVVARLQASTEVDRRHPVAGGAYVSVLGPQFETPAEAAWLASFGDVVGMSGAPEARAALRACASIALVALVVNAAADVSSHEEVLSRAAVLSSSLAATLVPLIHARWPELA